MTKANVKKVVKKKKVNNKDLEKKQVMDIIQNALEKEGLTFKCGVDYGMTNGTIIVEAENTDVQIKPISPKAGLERYQEIVYIEE